MNRQINYIIYAFLILLLLIPASYFLKIITSSVADSASAPAIESENVEKAKPSDPVYLLGESLFMNKCASCHNIFREIVGPPLENFLGRGPWADKNLLYKWIRDPEAFVKTDIYTSELRKRYVITMRQFPELKDSDIDAIVVYITKASEENLRTN